MNKKYWILFSLLLLALIAGGFFVGWWLPLTCVGSYIALYLTILVIQKATSYTKLKQSTKEIEEEIGERVWTVPAELICQSCSEIEEIDFHLGAARWNCPKCGSPHRLTVIVRPLIESVNQSNFNE